MPKVGEVVNGKVIKILKAGALVRLSTNEVGFLHISEISHEYVRNVRDVLSYGQEVSVLVLGVRKKENKIFLSMSKVKNDANQKIVFEAKMKKFLKDSGDKMKQIQKNKEKKQGIRRNTDRNR